MNIKIITDSCYDLPDKLLKKLDFDIVPISLIFDDETFKEKINITNEKFQEKLRNCKNPPSSASPSPAEFMSFFSEVENIFIVTISSALSSSYNNALLAKKLYMEKKKNNDILIHVFDSLNASIGQGLVLLKLQELIKDNTSINDIIETVENYCKNLKTYFLLEKLNNIINSGRMNKILGKIISVLNIKLILGKNDLGEIKLFKKVRGSKKALHKIVDLIGEEKDLHNKTLGIAHYRCQEKAERFKEMVKKRYDFKNIIITEMGPTIATYADENSLLISF